MNSDQHASNSAFIFGGKSFDYLKFHQIVDLNKLASSAIWGRFFLHHIDVGYYILKSIFGENIKNSEGKDVPTYELLSQHLLEDYAEIPSFIDWLDSFDAVFDKLPVAKEGEFLRKALKEDQMLVKLSERDFSKIEEIFNLSKFTKNRKILDHPARYCVFGHASGINLAREILGEKIGKQYTLDILVHYVDKKFGHVPEIVSYADLIEQREWMYAPEDYDRVKPQVTKKKLEDHLAVPKDKDKKAVSVEDSLSALLKAVEKDPEGHKRRIKKIAEKAEKERPAQRYSPPKHRNCGGRGVFD